MGKELLPSELLEQGWCQNAICRRDGDKVRYCLAGAANRYDGEESFINGFLLTAGSILMERDRYYRYQIKPNTYLPIYWNDQPCRTQEEVVALAKEVEERLGLKSVGTTLKPEEEPVPEPTPAPTPDPEPEGDEPPFVQEVDKVLVGVGD